MPDICDMRKGAMEDSLFGLLGSIVFSVGDVL